MMENHICLSTVASWGFHKMQSVWYFPHVTVAAGSLCGIFLTSPLRRVSNRAQLASRVPHLSIDAPIVGVPDLLQQQVPINSSRVLAISD